MTTLRHKTQHRPTLATTEVENLREANLRQYEKELAREERMKARGLLPGGKQKPTKRPASKTRTDGHFMPRTETKLGVGAKNTFRLGVPAAIGRVALADHPSAMYRAEYLTNGTIAFVPVGDTVRATSVAEAVPSSQRPPAPQKPVAPAPVVPPVKKKAPASSSLLDIMEAELE